MGWWLVLVVVLALVLGLVLVMRRQSFERTLFQTLMLSKRAEYELVETPTSERMGREEIALSARCGPLQGVGPKDRAYLIIARDKSGSLDVDAEVKAIREALKSCSHVDVTIRECCVPDLEAALKEIERPHQTRIWLHLAGHGSKSGHLTTAFSHSDRDQALATAALQAIVQAYVPRGPWSRTSPLAALGTLLVGGLWTPASAASSKKAPAAQKKQQQALVRVGGGLELVFVNSCHSASMVYAMRIAQVPCAIGWASACSDVGAAQFAAAFYKACGAGAPPAAAYAFAKCALLKPVAEAIAYVEDRPTDGDASPITPSSTASSSSFTAGHVAGDGTTEEDRGTAPTAAPAGRRTKYRGGGGGHFDSQAVGFVEVGPPSWGTAAASPVDVRRRRFVAPQPNGQHHMDGVSYATSGPPLPRPSLAWSSSASYYYDDAPPPPPPPPPPAPSSSSFSFSSQPPTRETSLTGGFWRVLAPRYAFVDPDDSFAVDAQTGRTRLQHRDAPFVDLAHDNGVAPLHRQLNNDAMSHEMIDFLIDCLKDDDDDDDRGDAAYAPFQDAAPLLDGHRLARRHGGEGEQPTTPHTVVPAHDARTAMLQHACLGDDSSDEDERKGEPSALSSLSDHGGGGRWTMSSSASVSSSVGESSSTTHDGISSSASLTASGASSTKRPRGDLGAYDDPGGGGGARSSDDFPAGDEEPSSLEGGAARLSLSAAFLDHEDVKARRANAPASHGVQSVSPTNVAKRRAVRHTLTEPNAPSSHKALALTLRARTRPVDDDDVVRSYDVIAATDDATTAPARFAGPLALGVPMLQADRRLWRKRRPKLLDANTIPYLGVKKLARLTKLGIHTVEDLALVDPSDRVLAVAATNNLRPDRAARTLAEWRDKARLLLIDEDATDSV